MNIISDLLRQLKDGLHREHDEVKKTCSILASMRQINRPARSNDPYDDGMGYNRAAPIRKDPGIPNVNEF